MTIKYQEAKDFVSALTIYRKAYLSEIKEHKAARCEDVMVDVVFHNDLKPDSFQFCTSRSASWIVEYSCPTEKVLDLISEIESLGFVVVKGTLS